MNVLSLFDGISCGQIALERAGIKVDNYYASEIKPIAIKVTQAHYPNTIQLGDVTKIEAKELPKIDLLIGGSPCQDFSCANLTRNGLEGEKSSLFYHYLRLLRELKPKYFLLENVKMKKRIITYRQKIDSLLANADNISPEQWNAILQEHLTQIVFFQHERLVHLIVTVTFAILTMISIVAALMICNPLLYALTLLFLVLLLPYIMHYYTLENEVQKI